MSLKEMQIRAEIENLYFKRLEITTYSGVTWRTDIRNYRQWFDVFNKSKDGVLTMTELPEEETYESMIERMVEYDMSDSDMNKMWYDITGKWLR